MLVGIISLVLIIVAISMFRKPIDNKPVLFTRMVQVVLLLVGVFGLVSGYYLAHAIGEILRQRGMSGSGPIAKLR